MFFRSGNRSRDWDFHSIEHILCVCLCFTICRQKESYESYACIIMCLERRAKKKTHCKLGNRHSGGHCHGNDGTDVKLQGSCKSNTKGSFPGSVFCFSVRIILQTILNLLSPQCFTLRNTHSVKTIFFSSQKIHSCD